MKNNRVNDEFHVDSCTKLVVFPLGASSVHFPRPGLSIISHISKLRSFQTKRNQTTPATWKSINGPQASFHVLDWSRGETELHKPFMSTTKC